MANLLHLDSSARRNSFSRALSDRFATAFRAADPGGAYVYRDLAAQPVPFIGEAWTELCDYVLANGITEIERYAEAARTPAQWAAWAIVEPLLAELVAADVIVIGVPMYNFSIPAALKAWLDQVTFPRMSLAGRSFVIASARGGSYLPGMPRAPFDHQERYLRDFFAGHFAVEDVTFLNSELTNALIDPALAHLRDKQTASEQQALAEADVVAKGLVTR